MTDYEPMAETIRGIDRFVDAELDEAELARRLADIKERADRAPETGGSGEIVLDGEIDVENAYAIREAVAQVLADGSPASIEINMWRVTVIDSVGVSAMIAAFQLAAVQGVRLVVTRPTALVHRQLWVTGLLALFAAPAPSAGASGREVTSMSIENIGPEQPGPGDHDAADRLCRGNRVAVYRAEPLTDEVKAASTRASAVSHRFGGVRYALSRPDATAADQAPQPEEGESDPS